MKYSDMKVIPKPGKTPPVVRKNSVAALAESSKRFRRLKSNELVTVGDFVSVKENEFEPWDGPRGFQAGSFVQPIYREQTVRSRPAKKSDN